MSSQVLVQLEDLLSGSIRHLEIRRKEITRELILDHLNHIITSMYPHTWTKGRFVEDTECIVYELDIRESCIRISEFSDKFNLLRV